jgi:hypothetical protein
MIKALKFEKVFKQNQTAQRGIGETTRRSQSRRRGPKRGGPGCSPSDELLKHNGGDEIRIKVRNMGIMGELGRFRS